MKLSSLLQMFAVASLTAPTADAPMAGVGFAKGGKLSAGQDIFAGTGSGGLNLSRPQSLLSAPNPSALLNSVSSKSRVPPVSDDTYLELQKSFALFEKSATAAAAIAQGNHAVSMAIIRNMDSSS